MYVKSLTLRGFKSFASATSLRFEPGITCVVGPNGAGKSNIVDAFAWVMGEQGAKTLRGGKMDDVVFAGTASRPALGRAEVTLTIDNSDGALPIDYTEVTISRLLFRSGQSEYSINGNHCRLLDVTELLSDSGLGREMHVIVGQGQLDEVLHAGPEARRALIEEAAGVLKHRRRKEKALRKLEAMQANLTRLVDLTAELRRRLGPLGRQAAIARRAAAIQADLRDARLRLLADDYVTVAAELERGQADEAAVLARRGELERALTQARHQESVLDADEQEQAPRLAGAQEAWFSLSALAERLRGMGNLARERHTHLTAGPGPAPRGRDPDELEAQAESLREQEAALGERLEAARSRLSEAASQRQDAEARAAEAERLIAARARAAARQAELLAALRGQVGAARSRVAASEDEGARLADALQQAQERAQAAKREYEQHQDLAAGRQDDREHLAAEHEQAAATLQQRSADVARCRAAERAASAERAAVAARKDALEEGIRALMEGADATAALLADPQWSGDVLGVVAAMLTVADGAQDAITAALGDAADAVAIAGLDAAVAVLQRLRETGAGAAGLVIAAEHPGAPSGLVAADRLPPGVTPALDLVEAPPGLAAALAGLLDDVVVCDSLAAGRDIVRARPQLRVVTREGDLLGAHWAHGGAARPPSTLAMRAAADEAAAGLAAAEQACAAVSTELATAAAGEERAREAAQRALAALQACDKLAAEVSGRLGRLAGAARAAGEEAARLTAAVTSVKEKRERDHAKLRELSAKLAEAEAGDAGDSQDSAPAAAGGQEPGPAPDRQALLERVTAARETEMEARLEVRTAEERLRAIEGRAGALAAAAAGERRAARAAAAQRRRREQQAVVAGAVARGAGLALERIAQSLAVAEAERLAAQEASKGRAEALKQIRSQVRTLAAELDKVVDSAHGAEITRAEHRMRLEQIAARATDEFGVDVATLAAEYGPDVPAPAPAEPPAARPARKRGAAAVSGNGAGGSASGNGANRAAGDGAAGDGAAGDGAVGAATAAQREGHPQNEAASTPPAATVPYVRAEQEKRAATAQRQLDQLGKVNPLALEEFAALEERHAFLAAQLEDLKKTRRDLLTVVKEVDDRVQEVFASAFADTAAEFQQIFARLFPGGEGRLVLTEPGDILATGIDVEARPPGKKVKRLSLLSGGERSLTAIAYLVAIFKARPSPFYVLDEVEAALDDINLQRLLAIFEELRDSSQLIVVTHQKRTMEVADALYGISMRGDGVSAVVSQRLRERERA